MRTLLGSALILVPVPASAQAYQCRLPPTVVQPRPALPDGPRLRTSIGGYTLAISWSPEFCRGKSASDPGNYQCNGKIGRFGFILHGLWPEAQGGGKPPQWCAITPRPSTDDFRRNLCMTPVPWLIEHEWAKHGSCMAREPQDYFKVSAILWNSLRLPEADRLSRKEGLTAGDLRSAFVSANGAFPKSSVGIVVSNGGWLRELYLCYGKDFLPRTCSARSFGPKDTLPLKIWRGL
nr:ribonuclease T [Novosphingobium sp.]